MSTNPKDLYIVLVSVHGLIRGDDLELGRDADTGGQILYVVELAQALAKHPDVARVDLLTRLVDDERVSSDYAQPVEEIGDGARIVRIEAGPPGYIAKEQLWDHLDAFADNTLNYLRAGERLPDVIHGHYADAGYVGYRLANLLALPMVFTGHSLGRVKRRRLLASGLSAEDVERLYNITHRIEGEELALASAERVITSTFQEIEEQYELYDHYQPEQMRVIPPGTNLSHFMPPQGDEKHSALFDELKRFLNQPNKPMILALSRPDKRKNISALVKAYGESERLQQLANLVVVAGNRDDVDELEEGAQEVFHELFVTIDRYDLWGKIAFPKHHARNQVPLFYRLAASLKGVFVNPALTEPFGLTLIEAAACGLPLVATDDGGPRDIIENCNNGVLIDALDTDAMGTALVEIISDKDTWEQLSAAGLAGVREHYSWDAHASRYLEVIDPIVELGRKDLIERRPAQLKQQLYRSRAIFTDLDQNLIGDEQSLREFVGVMRQHRKLVKFGIATGRRLDSALKKMKQYGIPEPDFLITSGGTEIYYAPKLTVDDAWKKQIDYHWTPHIVRRVLSEMPGLELQPKTEQSRFKISYFYDQENAPDVREINSLLHKEEQSVNVSLAFGQFLDITPIRASKGLALRYISDRWGIPLEHILVAGGSGADEDMMRGNTLAAVVANRHNEELSQLMDKERIYFAERPFAAGILEAIEHYDFFGSCKGPDDR
ncbi:HAD family hydrolase [Candidatus Tenderia electrophaga]|jgi:sucrose-phosphate synthase|uniref:sucrose-phosphate synthase n=1 Tax=Candidatus Tenderia electrophaga TaxID=1748243 RepID=A0A0S2TDE0_9GAMM|nr:HAD family hydrolase [Candidatus Tenderia electrophaga]